MNVAARTTSAVHMHGEEQRTRWGRIWRYVLGPPAFWIDLLDAQRRPSHSKIMWTAAFAILNAILIHLTIHFTRLAVAQGRELSKTELAFLLAFAALSTCTAGGLDGFKTWAKTKGGGTVQAFSAVAKADAEAADHPGKAVESVDG